MASPFTTPEPVTQEDSLVTKKIEDGLSSFGEMFFETTEQETPILGSLFFKTEYTVEVQRWTSILT